MTTPRAPCRTPAHHAPSAAHAGHAPRAASSHRAHPHARKADAAASPHGHAAHRPATLPVCRTRAQHEAALAWAAAGRAAEKARRARRKGGG